MPTAAVCDTGVVAAGPMRRTSSALPPSFEVMDGAFTCFDIAIVVPTRDVRCFIEDCLTSILCQTGVDLARVELIVYDDASTDGTYEAVEAMLPDLQCQLGRVELLRGKIGPVGCGSGRNRASERSTASILVFLDSDDIMLPCRLRRTLQSLDIRDNVKPREEGEGILGVVGGNFDRFPGGSTPRYEEYHRKLRGTAVLAGKGMYCGELFPFAFRDTPLAMPTVSCLRRVWEDVGGFAEGPLNSEDLIFVYAALDHGYKLLKIGGESIMRYRFHDGMSSNQLSRRYMLGIRVAAFERLVVAKQGWERFSIWGCGRDAKEVFKVLSHDGKRRVAVWGEINPRRIGRVIHGVKVVHFTELKPPIALCVALDRTDGEFESNLADMNLMPGVDYVHLT
jgi:glycosyltransferase involved in cell wall biosynthesis